MGKFIDVTLIQRPEGVTAELGLTNKSAIPAYLCDTIKVNCDEIQKIVPHTFNYITTATAENKTGSVLTLPSNSPLREMWVKQSPTELQALIDA